ncbi:MAG: TetR/AcrR family transcriptional regulator, partial [Myxococcota bacterium]
MPEQRDGRHMRSEQSRRDVVQAVVDSIRERGEMPIAEDIATRAGVSRRTVFRLFDDLETLHHAAEATLRSEVLARFPPPGPARSLAAGLDAIVAHRCDVYEYIRPFRRLADRLAHEQPVVAQ